MKSTDQIPELEFETRAIHHANAKGDNGAVVPPIYMTSTYAFDSVEDVNLVASGERTGFVYGREFNPTQTLLERRLADLEGAEAAVTTASGMGAISALFLSLLSPGDEVITHHTMYSNTEALMNDGLPRFGINVIRADLSDPAALQKVTSKKAKLVYFETPINPTGGVLDIRAIADAAHALGLRIVVDSTFASPAVQRPLEHGADIVVHSLTKYINGHGDVLGGVVLGDQDTVKRVRGIGLRYLTGATLSPMACFLVLRGIKTLKLRMQQHSINALEVARMLDAHPAVRSVRYPYLPGQPEFAIAKKQMISGGGIMSLELHSGREGAFRFMNRLQLIQRAVSVGDVDSLIMHPSSLAEAKSVKYPTNIPASSYSKDLMRLSIGLEASKDLLDDLEQALHGE